jgi:sugar transferase (PEP-CTERM/EpsH1 system associated)
MKVLFLTTRLPVPPWRGDQVRAYHHLRLLARRHEITLCAMVLGQQRAQYVAETEALGIRVRAIRLGLAGAVPALARVALGDRRPLQVLLFARRAAAAAVAELLAAGRFDVVHAQLVRPSPYLPAARRPPVVLDLIDTLSGNFARRARLDRRWVRPLVAWEGARLARLEGELLRRVSSCLVVAETERAVLGGGPVRVVANGVDGEAFAYRGEGRPANRVVFAGNLGYFPNVDAACWLARDILPRLRAASPTIELRLAGARPARAVRRLAGTPGVTLAASVPDMAAELAAASVALVPLRSGSGMQNKVLEAMATGTPVVTTSYAAVALDARAGEHLLVADDAEGLAAATLGVLRDPPRARAMARAARALVERRYRWEESAAGVEAAWAEAADALRQAP